MNDNARHCARAAPEAGLAIRIVGDQATLEQVIAGGQNANPNVRSFVRKWRAIQNKTTNSYTVEIEL